MSDLTDRQAEILSFLERFSEREGLPPSIAEIQSAFGLASPRGVAKHLEALSAKGYLELVPHRARGIRLRRPRRPQRSRDQLQLPILGRVAAGPPIDAAAEFDESLLVDRALFHSRPDYLLRVKGDSMREDGIFDGDLVAIRRAVTAENGQTVVARIDGEITIKRLKITTRGIRLLPRNPDYAAIDVPRDADFAIEGLYCGLVRRG
ncbi:transcriptional repressor LexA [Luteimonas sp. 50]|uniref:LexA repressor n=1 Tax=Cognatiluteimonas sedimenti TaxID=2927791 RepID=A0ABT0A6N6_9GAMM|nr:transcriptional repressor LexA [Lysobacter sedimenti]MCJ0826648.1 transcriptional repressor LexA [Lysobacter sedimenti]